jgi:hypothetical protein
MTMPSMASADRSALRPSARRAVRAAPERVMSRPPLSAPAPPARRR